MAPPGLASGKTGSSLELSGKVTMTTISSGPRQKPRLMELCRKPPSYQCFPAMGTAGKQGYTGAGQYILAKISA